MKLSHIVIIILSATVLALPAVLFGFPRFGDGATHALWYTHFVEQLWTGDLYPRWLQGMNGGLGEPAFFYYGPVPFYITSLLRPFFALDPLAWHQLGVSAALALAASGVTAYLWLRDVTGQSAALPAACFYMLLPYHLAVDLYERGAFAEFWGFVWLPLILYFVRARSSRGRAAFAGLALSYALLVMTHLPTTLIFSPVPVAYACVVRGEQQVRRKLAHTVGAMALGVGLAAIYFLPAMLTQDFVSITKMSTDYYYYGHHFLFTTLRNGLPLFISGALLVTVGLAACAYALINREANAGAEGEARFWLVVAAISAFMMTPLSKPVWLVIPVLGRIQFPWRFGTILCVATALLSVLAISSPAREGNKSHRRLWATVSASLVAVCLVATAYSVWDALLQTGQRASVLAIKEKDQERVTALSEKLALSKGNAGFHPKWATSSSDVGGLQSLLQRIGREDGTLRKVRVAEGVGGVVVRRWGPRDILLDVTAPGGAVLNVSQYYYPGWTARLLDESGQDLDVRPTDADGLVGVAVPNGHHLLSLRLRATTPEYLGRVVSALSAAITLYLLITAGWHSLRRHILVRRAASAPS